MQATLPLSQPVMKSAKHAPVSPNGRALDAAAVEIYSYLAARDLLLREAEADPNDSTLSEAKSANELAQSCLRPTRSPYQAQSLPEAEAARERQRCQEVKARLAQLRTRAALRRRAA